MKGRFGREIVCPGCGKDDKIVKWWEGKFAYYYWCNRCKRQVPG